VVKRVKVFNRELVRFQGRSNSLGLFDPAERIAQLIAGHKEQAGALSVAPGTTLVEKFQDALRELRLASTLWVRSEFGAGCYGDWAGLSRPCVNCSQ
jgi:hypothetical protein